MPIHFNRKLDLEKDLVPILMTAGLSPRGDGNDIWFNGGYVTICNGLDLYLRATNEVAELIEKQYQPFGEPLEIHLYAPDERDEPEETWGLFGRLFG